jgi:hypothetical protein
MDALRDSELDRVAFTYDIWCKWRIHLDERMRNHFPDFAPKYFRMQRRGFIPKLHNKMHGLRCQTIHCINLFSGMARTDGESTERDWASIVVAALQTGEMNLGSRHEALGDHWADKNFQRLVGLSKSFSCL